MGILESILAMGIGKLIVLGILSTVVGIPVLALLAGTAICVVCGPLFLLNPPWKEGGVLASPRRSSQTRILSFGIVLLAIGIGIIVSVYGVSQPSVWGIAGITISFGGLGLIVSYFVTSAIEKRRRGEKE